MFKAPVPSLILFGVLAPWCAMSAGSEGTPTTPSSLMLIFEPVGPDCPGASDSVSTNGLLEDLSLVLSGIPGVSFPGSELAGPSWRSLQHFERAKEVSGADAALAIQLRCDGDDAVHYSVAASRLPDGALIARAEGNAGEDLLSLRDPLLDDLLGILDLRKAIDGIDRTSRAVLQLYLQGSDVAAAESPAARALLLNEATGLDRDFTPAWTRLGEIELSRGEEGGGGFEAHFCHAEDALRQALLRRSYAPAAVHALASVYMRTGRTRDAIETLRNGIEARPDSALLHAKLGYAFRYAGMLDRSIAEYRLAQQLDAGYDNLVQCERQIIKALIYSGRYEEAADAYGSVQRWLSALGLEPDEKMPFYQGVGRYYAGDTKGAVRFFDTSIAKGSGLWSDFAAAYRAAALGEQAELIRLADALERGNVSDGERRYRLAHLNALAGRKEKALEHLEASAQSGFFSYPYTKGDRLLKNISEADEFDRIVGFIKTRHLALAASYQ